MRSLVFLVPLALLLGGAALVAFLWSLGSGQYDDLDGAAERILFDENDAAEERPPQGEPPSPADESPSDGRPPRA